MSALRECLFAGEHAQPSLALSLPRSPPSTIAVASPCRARDDGVARRRREARGHYPLQSWQGELGLPWLILIPKGSVGHATMFILVVTLGVAFPASTRRVLFTIRARSTQPTREPRATQGACRARGMGGCGLRQCGGRVPNRTVGRAG